jgi:hypothetical protein
MVLRIKSFLGVVRFKIEGFMDNTGFDVHPFQVRYLTNGVKQGRENTGLRYQFKCAILLTELNTGNNKKF